MAPLVELIKDIRTEFPEFVLLPKIESRLMRVIDLLLRIITFNMMCTFMTRYTTTIGYTVYIPQGWTEDTWLMRAEVLRHERVHMRQCRRLGRPFFYACYLLLPLPLVFAYCRLRFEQEAYEESMRACYEYYGIACFTSQHKERMLEHFSSAAYFWTWPWRGSLSRWYDDALARILGRYA